MTLWTPDGERKIPPAPAGDAATPSPAAGGGPGPDEPELTPEEEEQVRVMAKELAEARARLLETEVATVLTNHALGIYELAAIHLTAERPDLDEARLAIDALAAIVENLAGRLGESEATLKGALHQVRMAYVQRARPEAPAAGD